MTIKYNDFHKVKKVGDMLINHNESLNISKIWDEIKTIGKEELESFLKKLGTYLDKFGKSTKLFAFSSLVALMIGGGFDYDYLKNTLPDDVKQEITQSSTEQNILNKIYKDYKKKADKYLARDIFKGTPITGKMLADAALNAFNEYGVLVPLELALAQGQWESRLGTDKTHRNPITNPFSVGEYDTHTHMRFNSTKEGVEAYYNLMAKDYLKYHDMDELLDNFVNKNGDRYASDKEYEKKIKSTIKKIKSYW